MPLSLQTVSSTLNMRTGVNVDSAGGAGLLVITGLAGVRRSGL